MRITSAKKFAYTCRNIYGILAVHQLFTVSTKQIISNNVTDFVSVVTGTYNKRNRMAHFCLMYPLQSQNYRDI
jgi:hypothetical protein